jgi:phytoene dehydrogenase-like protein
MRSGRVSGVALDSGVEIEADNVVSTIDVKRVAGMLPQEFLTAPWRKAVAGSHSGLFNVGEIKVDAALDRPPVFRGETPEFAGSLKYLMHAPDAYVSAMRIVTGGRIPAPLPLMVVIPSADDPSQCPPGKATLWASAFVRNARAVCAGDNVIGYQPESYGTGGLGGEAGQSRGQSQSFGHDDRPAF